MASFSKTKSSSNQSVVFDFIKGIIVASLASLALVILFAFFIKWFDISDGYLNLITLLIKAVSVIIGSIFAVKGDSKGLVKGVVFGLIYIIFAFVIFSFLAAAWTVSAIPIDARSPSP